VSANCEESVFTVQKLEMQGLQKMIIQNSQELQEVCNTTKLMGKKWVLGEVFCSDQSPWTHQVLQAEESAFSFGLQQGDLSTMACRTELFKLLVCKAVCLEEGLE
jgi:hypothetical protein